MKIAKYSCESTTFVYKGSVPILVHESGAFQYKLFSLLSLYLKKIYIWRGLFVQLLATYQQHAGYGLNIIQGV